MSSSEKKTFASSTDSVHAGTPEKRPHHALSLGIHTTATFTFKDTAELERYMRGEDPDPEREEYGRYGNPTVCELERRVADLDLAEAGVAFSSGMSAISTAVLSLVKSGEHIVLFRDGYRRTRQLVTQTLARFGVEHTIVPSGDLNALSAALRDNTRLVIGESPTNPYLYCTDLAEMAKLVKARGRIKTLVDSTFATPVNCRPLEFGIDMVVHSATKYLSGHNDVLGGVIVGPTHLMSLLRDARGVLGSVLDPHAAFLIARGIKTLGVRVARQNDSALALARTLEADPRIERVFYPMLESHSSHAIAKTQMRGGGGVVSFIVKGGRAAASRLIDAVKIPKIAASLGGVESLIEQPAIMSYSELSTEELAKVGIDPALVRMSVGIEDTADLVRDLEQALQS